ncbi:phosphotransferase family protein [Deinococcus aestuarii]|uniref:phosphotransferase family protein n=1 Tax=Deinococcus aestuarii TaxID=2774531 RepID=UPI001C0B2047|nr:aminoglycoside 3'-phosphotransferase/choline kinase family protein [Deinococcus aestuarii]
MSALPESVSYEAFVALHTQPLAPWKSALEEVRARHALPPGEFRRFPLGKNAVFALADVAVKLVPPLWSGDARREAAALRLVRGRLSLPTPEVVASGELGAWRYVVTARLPGRPLREVWWDLPGAERARLAEEQAALLREVHAVQLDPAAAAELHFDWPGLLLVQGLELPRELRAPPVLREGAAAFLEGVFRAGPGFARPHALLHGDLNFLNLLCEERDGRVTLTALIDWSDARLGPPTHDLISPAVNQFRRDPAARRAWSAALGLTPDDVREATARALLYYPDEWAGLLADLGAQGARDWPEVGAVLFGLT